MGGRDSARVWGGRGRPARMFVGSRHPPAERALVASRHAQGGDSTASRGPRGPERLFLLPASLHTPCVHAKSLQSCSTLCNPIDCSSPASSVHGISPGKNTGGGCRVLLHEDLPDPGMEPTSVMPPALAGGFFTTGATWEAPLHTGYALRPFCPARLLPHRTYMLHSFPGFLEPPPQAGLACPPTLTSFLRSQSSAVQMGQSGLQLSRCDYQTLPVSPTRNRAWTRSVWGPGAPSMPDAGLPRE